MLNLVDSLTNGAAKDKRAGQHASHAPSYMTTKNVNAGYVGLERQNTADIINDPRLYSENVIDKRLAAFEALAIVTEIMAAEAVKQCFELPADFKLVGPFWHVAIFQVIGFGIMIGVLYLTTTATAVLSLQLFFAIRLMTAGPTGFDKSARFYTDKRMWVWRERAVFGVKWSIVGFFLSTGFMLYVKIYTEGAPESTTEHDEREGRSSHKFLAGFVLLIFLILSAQLTILVRTHQRVFDECYASVDMCHASGLSDHLMGEEVQPLFAETETTWSTVCCNAESERLVVGEIELGGEWLPMGEVASSQRQKAARSGTTPNPKV